MPSPGYVRTVAATLGTAALLVLTPAAASAADATTSPDQPRAELLCTRVGVVSERVDAMIARLRGDATTVGSLAWLEAAAATAKDAGRTRLAEALEDRLAIRRERLDVLVRRAAALDEAAKRCAAAGLPAAP